MCGWGVSWERFFKVISVEKRLLSLFAQFTDHISTVSIHPCSPFGTPTFDYSRPHPPPSLNSQEAWICLEAGHLLKGHRREFIDTRDTTPEYSR